MKFDLVIFDNVSNKTFVQKLCGQGFVHNCQFCTVLKVIAEIVSLSYRCVYVCAPFYFNSPVLFFNVTMQIERAIHG